MTSQITKTGNTNEQGMILGVLSSVMSLSMIIGPIVAGSLFAVKISLPFWVSALFAFSAFIIVICEKRKNLRLEKISDEALEITEQKMEFAS
jgi:MFS family permease